MQYYRYINIDISYYRYAPKITDTQNILYAPLP